MPLHPTERTAWRRCFAAGALLFTLSAAGTVLSSATNEIVPETDPVTAPLVSYALDQLTPQLQLVQVGKWLARTLFDRPQPSRCG